VLPADIALQHLLSQHSGDWLFALPIASCGLKLDEAVRVTIQPEILYSMPQAQISAV